jgi:hypothetical protein
MKADARSHRCCRSNVTRSPAKGGRKSRWCVVAALCAVIAIVALPAARAADTGAQLSSTARGTIPAGKYISLSPHGLTPQQEIATSTNSFYANTHEAVAFLVVDKGAGRVAFYGNGGFLSVDPFGVVSLHRGGATKAETLQWVETATGGLTLLSLSSHHYLRVDSVTGAVWADGPVKEDTKTSNEIQFDWKVVAEAPIQSLTREPAQ